MLDEQPADLLTEGMRRFATGEQFAGGRAQLRPYVEHAGDLVYLRPDSSGGERLIYKISINGETTYLAVVWRQGKLAGVQRMDR